MTAFLVGVQGVILAGGLGTRLGALTRARPKPLMDVAGRPFLRWLVEAAAGQGVRRFLLLCGHLADQVEALAAALEAEGLEMALSVEEAPLGTGGALALAGARLDRCFLLFNGDSLFAIPLARLIEDGQGGAPAARMALRREADVARYGAVELQGERVTRFTEKQAVGGAPTAGLVNGGVYWMDWTALDGAPTGAFSLEQDLFPRLAGEGRLQGRVFEAPFVDIGLPDSLEAAQAIVPAALAGLSPPPG